MDSEGEVLCEVLNDLYSIIDRLRELDDKRVVELLERAYREIDKRVDENLDIADDDPPEWS
tara:strand:+ start:3517 stop:3699 length:183 start_codon:yes stop_codon:yes gene_type:complete